MRVLILGGTGEASALAARLGGRADVDAVLSYAGRTSSLKPQPVPVRVGGFGGAEGLARHLVDARIDALVDATHPFAERISRNAAEAARRTGTPLVVLGRPAWTPGPGDDWTEVDDLAAAARALGAVPRRVLLTVGRLGLAAFAAAPAHAYLVRSIDPPEAGVLPGVRVILDRPPYDAAAEERLMRAEGIEVLVSKNSGGAATAGKLAAARALGVRVVMVRPPARGDVPVLHDPEAAVRWIEAHRPSSGTGSGGAERGV